jgi:hypothetical protein
MRQIYQVLRMFRSIILLNVLILGPVARPIITPRVAVLMVVSCQNEVTGIVVVRDAQGRTAMLDCRADQWTMLSPAWQTPTANAPWLVTLTVQPDFSRSGLPRTCRSLVTRVPIHVQCAAASPAPLSVDLATFRTFAQ